MSHYAPLNTLKPIGEDIWIVDGPDIRFFGMPFSTRMTVIRLDNGDIWLHSPTKICDGLRDEVATLGPVKHLISPNWLHYAYIDEWAAAFPDTIAWASPKVENRAKKAKIAVQFDRDLGDKPPKDWAGQIDQMLVKGSKIHQEIVFFHRASATLILTDLIENFEPEAIPFWFRQLARLIGVLHPNGKMPIDMWMTFRAGKKELNACVEEMVGWKPRHIVLAHGRCYDENCAFELRRAFQRAQM